MTPIIKDNTYIYIKELPNEIEPLMPLCSQSIRDKVEATNSPRRKREIVASHLLIKEILGENVSIAHDQNGAPILVGAQEYISISHSATEIAIAINPHCPIGIDIENWRDQLIKVKSRFLSQKEMEVYATPQLMLKAWTIKESLYKVAQVPGISLADDIILPSDGNDNIAIVKTPQGECQFLFHIITSSPSRCVTLAHPL
jgi:phosphopantetheinyl transferase